MSDSGLMQSLGLTPEAVKKLEKLKAELEALSESVQNVEGKSKYEVEGLIRAFQDKEGEIKWFLREIGIMPDG